MDLIVAEKMAIHLMDKFGLRLLSNYWSFKWSNAKKSCGYCHSGKQYIKLSSLYVIHSSEQDVKDTILHEIAHALVGVKNHHNHIWKNKCFEIGATPVRCSKESVRHEGKWEIWCPKCGLIGYKYRKFDMTRRRICIKCNSTVEIKINEKFCQK